VRYISHKPDQAPLVMRIRDLAATRTRYGYFRIYILLRREGWIVNHKRAYRLYRDDGLSLRLKKPRRNVSAANRVRQPAASAANEMWSMDFVSDALFDGRRLRALTVVDAFTRLSQDRQRVNRTDAGDLAQQLVIAMLREPGLGDLTPDQWPSSAVMLAGVGNRSISARNQSDRLLPAKRAISGK
jgi:putative transposase